MTYNTFEALKKQMMKLIKTKRDEQNILIKCTICGKNKPAGDMRLHFRENEVGILGIQLEGFNTCTQCIREYEVKHND